MNLFSNLIVVLSLSLLALRVEAKVYVHITAEDGVVDYDISRSAERGWYAEPDCPGQKFSLGFKQGERYSAKPVLVATIKRTDEEHFMGKSALEMQIIARQENKVGSTAAYKLSFDVSPGKLVMVGQPKNWYLGFAMKIDPLNYSLLNDKKQSILFQQWWQGSPYHPPVSLQILNQAAVSNLGWKDANPSGNFALAIKDVDHNPGGPNDKGQTKYYNLGPVQTGQWLKWVICVRPDPSGGDGAVSVWINEDKKIELHPIVVGFNQDPKLGNKTGSKDLWVNLDIYRLNGLCNQRFFFDEIKLADSFDEAH